MLVRDVAALPSASDFLLAGGEMGALIRAGNWSASPLGPSKDWPQALKTLVGVMLGSNQPMFIAWGPGRSLLYNDSYAEILAAKHPLALGRDFLEVWSEIRADLMPIVEEAYAGRPIHMDDIELVMHRRGYPEETHFAFSYTPVRNEDGTVAGFFCPCVEITEQVLGRRRREALLELDGRMRDVSDNADLSFAASELLGQALGVARAGYGVLNPEARTIAVERNWAAPGFADVAGLHRFEDYGTYIEELLQGEAVTNADVEVDPRTADRAAAFRSLGISAHLDVPVLEDGQAVAQMFVHSATPRVWTDEEVAFVRDFAERTRAAMARRAAEQDLRASEAELRFTLKAGRLGAWTLDIATGELTTSETCRVNFGRDPQNPFTYAQLRDAVHPDDKERMSAAVERSVATGSDYDIEYRIVTPADETRWVAIRARPSFAPDGRPLKMTGVSLDATERKRTEEALHKSEARYRTLFGSIESGFCVVEVNLEAACGRIDYRVVEANPAFYRQTGFSDRTLGRWLREAAPDLEEHWYESYGRVARTGEPERFEQGSDMLRRWFDVFAFPVGEPDERRVAILFNDISARRNAEARLRELNDTLEEQVAVRSAERDRLWNLSEDMLARADYGGMMSAVSPAWTRILGWSEAELLTRSYATLMHPDDLPPTLEAIGSMAEIGEPVRLENRIATAAGGFKPIEWTVVPEPNGVNFIAVGRDLSLAKARQAELEAAREALRQSQKLESMGQLTGGVAHDLNNLLTPIMGSLDLLHRRGVGSEREQRMIDGALQSAERARVLVQRLLAFARRQPLQAIAVDVGILIEGLTDLVASTSGPRVHVELDIAPGLPPAKADANQLEMAFLNLAVNSRDAMPDGGQLTISAKPETVGAEHSAKLAPGDYVRVSVADTGAGMDEATLARAIEPFYSTKGIGKGTGLGLSMVHGLAGQLGGALSISSRPGVGTKVDLWLPVSLEAVQGTEPSVGNDKPASGTALLVDDEELVRMSTADMLTDMGYAVVQAESAEEALRLVEGGLAFDVLVTDHLMVGMTGTELARQVRASRPNTPVLIVSGYAEVEGIALDLPRLTKPYRRDDLAASVAELTAGT